MQNAFEFAVVGAPKIEAMLKDLEPKLRRSILKDAVYKGADAVLSTALQLVPHRSGALARSLRVIGFRPKRGQRGIIGATVVCSGGSKDKYTKRGGFFQGDQFYGGFQEFGWHVGKRPKNIVRLQRAASRRGPMAALA